jgi:hypothetical protein
MIPYTPLFEKKLGRFAANLLSVISVNSFTTKKELPACAGQLLDLMYDDVIDSNQDAGW